MSGTITGVVSLGGLTDELTGVTIYGATFVGPGTLETSGVNVNGAELTDGAAWINSGILDIVGGQIGGGPLDNKSGAVIDVSGDNSPFLPGATITNAGTLESDTAGTTNIQAAVYDTGAITINPFVGTLDFSGVSYLAGPVTGSGVLEFSSVVELAPDFSHTGVLELESGSAELVLGGTTTTLNGSVGIAGADINGPGTLATTGTVAVTGAALTDGAVWINSGLLDILGGQIGGGPLINKAGGTVVDAVTGDNNPFLPGVILTNAGKFVSDNAGTTIIQAEIDDTGTIAINAGTLDFNGVSYLDGPVTGSGVLEFSSVVELAPEFSHTGVLELESGSADLILGGTTTNLAGPVTIAGSYIEGPGTLATTGTVTLEGVQLAGGAVWSNSGTIDIVSGQFGGGPLINQSGAVLNLMGDANPFLPGITVTNAGTMETGGTLTTVVQAAINDTGTIVIGGGTLESAGGGRFAGPIKGPGVLELTSISTLAAGFSHSGLLEIETGAAAIVLGSTTTNLAGPVTIAGSYIEGPGTLATTGTVTVEGVQLAGGAVWSNSGTIDIVSGQFGGGPLINQSGAVLNLTGDANPFLPGITVTNAGTMETGGTITTVVQAAINDTGTIVIGGGTLASTGGGRFAGPVKGPGVLELTSISTLAAGFSHSGLLEIETGAAAIVLGSTTTNLAGPVTIAGSYIEGPGTLATTGTVTVEGVQLVGGAVWSNSGTIDIISGQFGGGSLINQSGAVVNLTGDSNPFLPGITVTNAGAMESGGSGTTVVQAAVSNTGTIVTTSGTLNLVGSVTGAGSVQIDAGAVVDIGGAIAGGTMKFLGTAEAIIANASEFGSHVGTANYTGPLIENFIPGDKIDLLSVSITNLDFSYSTKTGLLQINNGTIGAATLLFQNSSLGSGSFSITNDGSGHALVTHS